MPDSDITCSDCNTSFILSEGEQAWLTERFGKDYRAPKRCRDCRRKRKLERDGQSER